MLLHSVCELERKYKDQTALSTDLGKLMSATSEQKGVYNWFPFFQAFTSGFLEDVFNRDVARKSKNILDPFAGSGTTLVSCIEFGKNGYGLEINPLFRFVADVKTKKFSEMSFLGAENLVTKTGKDAFSPEYPNLSSFEKLFDSDVLKRLLVLRNAAYEEKNDEVTSILLFALSSELLSFSSAKRYGKGLHIVKKPRFENVDRIIIQKLRRMHNDYLLLREKAANSGFAYVAPFGILDTEKVKELPAMDLVITSPPYCNSSDYVEMYKLELWFLKYVTDRSEFKDLSSKTVRSHLSFCNKRVNWSHACIDEICFQLHHTNLWNPKITEMIRGYFDDLHLALENIKLVLKEKGRAFIAIGNSSYGGVVIPSDLLLAQAAEDLGLNIECLEVARHLPTSSQQAKLLDKESKLMMRESIVVLSR